MREGIDRVDAVLFTHTHADHVHGIDDLRTFSLVSGEAIPVYASAESLQAIQRVFAYIFTDESEPGYRPRLQLHTVEQPFELFGLQVVPVPLDHGTGSALGYRLGGLAYLTDCSAIPQGSWSLLEGVELLIIDALRFRPHTSHLSVAQAIEVARRIAPRRTLLTHLSHDVDSTRHAGQLPAGIEFAYDGQAIALPLTV
ncbi:MAG: MBL fold metallo-hydrolase [Desulfuromonas sp.]|nr:MAG: MBL fold metallo-hydrolase [Desulfuromonas sp.]